MKAILFSVLILFGSIAAEAQTTIKPPGNGESYKIAGTYQGEMIRSTGGVDKKREHYYLEITGEAIIIWKHIIVIETKETELLTKTTCNFRDIDWTYFNSANGEEPVEKKVSGKLYYSFSIYANRGKRFEQVKYTNEIPVDVKVGNLDIHLNSKEEANNFFSKVKATQN